MKTLSTLFFLTFFATFSFAQKQAVTENGEEVILYDNGTWIYKNQGTETTTTEKEIPTSKKKFTKDKKSTFLLKSQKTNIGF